MSRVYCEFNSVSERRNETVSSYWVIQTFFLLVKKKWRLILIGP